MNQSHEIKWAVRWAEEKPGSWSRFEGPLAAILQKLFAEKTVVNNDDLNQMPLRDLPRLDVMDYVTYGTECQVALRLEIPA